MHNEDKFIALGSMILVALSVVIVVLAKISGQLETCL